MAEDNSRVLKPCNRDKLLIVDDEAQIRKMFKFFVEADIPGVQVDVAADGKEAHDIFMKGHHAALLMDLHMPVMDGVAAFREIEDYCDVEDWEVPVIVFCTAYDAPSDAQRILRKYPQAVFLKKPINQNSLCKAIREALFPTG